MKILITLVGVGDIKPVPVHIPWAPDSQREEPDSAHQIALQRAICPERTWLVGTPEALGKNGAAIPHDAEIMIPKGENPAEFWEMFQSISVALAERLSPDNAEHEIHLDITNGYRVQPMFLNTAIRYHCQLSNSRNKLSAVYYNQFDASNATRPSQLLRVTPMLELEEFARDVNLLLGYSLSSPLANRLETMRRGRFLQMRQMHGAVWNPRTDEVLRILQGLHSILKKFGAVVTINHTPLAAATIRDLCAQAGNARSVFCGELQPIGQALGYMRDSLQDYIPGNGGKLWQWHAALAKWALNQSLTQQALTHAEEMVTTRLCEELGENPLDRDYRMKTGRRLKRLLSKPVGTARILREWHDLLAAWGLVIERRNKVNHAFTGSPDTQQPWAFQCDSERDIARLVELVCAMETLPAMPEDDAIATHGTGAVRWLSRHGLSDEQCAAIRFLHGDQVEVITENVLFQSPDDLAAYINGHSSDFIYAVAGGAHYLRAVELDCEFGFFENDPVRRENGSFGLNAVYHVRNRQLSKVWPQ